MIIERATEHFAKEGFAASTRELSRRIGVTQSLLYRYFPTKEDLIDKVYQRVYVSRWNPFWEELIQDAGRPIDERLKAFYIDYAHTMLRGDWVRILIFAGLKQAGINERLFALLRERIYKVVVNELRREFDLPPPRTNAEAEMELELVWALHASIFYLGMRRWVYSTAVPVQIDPLLVVLVDGFIASFRSYATSHSRQGPGGKASRKRRT